MNDTYALVSIITVNYNGKKFIDDYFAALSELDYPQDKLELIFVDNGSSDGSVDYVKEKFPSVIIIENPQNNYAGGNNLGVKKAQGDFIAFLNT